LCELTLLVVCIGMPELRQGSGGCDNNKSHFTLSDLAHGIANNPCCSKNCLSRMETYSASDKLVLTCLEETHNMTREEKLQYLKGPPGHFGTFSHLSEHCVHPLIQTIFKKQQNTKFSSSLCTQAF
jgi:hypothetical protein